MSLTYRLRGSKIDFSFSPTGGPMDDSSPHVRELFEKLGRAAAAWGKMEFLLDANLVVRPASRANYMNLGMRSALRTRWTC